jgi:gas vesicle protein
MNRLLVGAMTGLIVGLLFAPQIGEKTRGFFKERFSSFRNAPMGRESMKEGWTGGTNDRATKKSFESTVREDYLH